MHSGIIILSTFAISLSACGPSQPKPISGQVQSNTQNTHNTQTPVPVSQFDYATFDAITSLTPLPGPCSTPEPDQLNDLINRSITIKDNGKSFIVQVTSRFWFYLDDRIYPLRDLLISMPDGLIGYVSNGSFRGAQCYPVMFEAVREGRGLLQINDFQLLIIIDNNMPESPLPIN
jgi:hypothetical protein